MIFDYKNTRPYQFVKLAQETAENLGEMNMMELSRQHGFTKGRLVRLEFQDEHKYYDLQMKDGHLRPVLIGTPDLRMVLPLFCTVKHMRVGWKRYIARNFRNEVVQNEVYQYTPWNAWEKSDIYAKPMNEDTGVVTDVWMGRTNETLQALLLIAKVMEAIPSDRLVALSGPCEHDP